MAADESSQWLFTANELKATPSVCEGLDPADERNRRAKGANFIFQAGILLKLPQMTIGVATAFFHRFFMRRSMVMEKPGSFHHYSIAATALFLATKTEENCRKTKEIVIAVAKVAQKNASLIIDEQSKEYWRWRDAMLLYEEAMLEYLTFDLVLTSPYALLYTFLQQLHIEEHKQMRNCAWAFLNDSCMTMLCLAMPAKDIAVAACYFAIKFHGETIPDDEETGEPWWEALGGRPDKIVEAVNVMDEFWTSNPLSRSDNPYAGYPPSSSEDLDRTRRRANSDVSSIISPPSLNGESIKDATPKRKEVEEAEEPVPKRPKVEESTQEGTAVEDYMEPGEEKDGAAALE